MEADDIDVLNLLRNTTGLSNPAKVTLFDVTRHTHGRTYQVIVHIHDLGPDSHPARFSAVAYDKLDPSRRVSCGFFPDVRQALEELKWSQID